MKPLNNYYINMYKLELLFEVIALVHDLFYVITRTLKPLHSKYGAIVIMS